MRTIIKKTLSSLSGISFSIIAIAILFIILDKTIGLPGIREMFTESVSLTVSVVAVIGFFGIILLFIINILYTKFLQQQKEQQINRSKNELMSLVSHQLRTPLSAVNWYTESLLGEPLSSSQKEYLKNIQESNNRMVTMVSAILTISQVELGNASFQADSVNMHELVDQTLLGFQFSLERKKITVQKNITTPASIITDAQYTRLILDNLVANAIKYSPEQSIVVITVSEDTKNCTIAVADQGIGIPSEDREKIFTKLFRAHNVLENDTDGMGLGLYMIKTIIDRFGGTISFTNNKPAGTIFTVTIPLAQKNK